MAIRWQGPHLDSSRCYEQILSPQVPISAVMLMDETSMYIKSTSAKLAKKTPTDRRISFAAWMMLSLKPELLVIENFQQDKR